MDWVVDHDGSKKAFERPGPANLMAWNEGWNVFATAAVMLKIARPAVLEVYRSSFEERARLHPEAWHLCVRADVRCRTELWMEEKRRQANWHAAAPAQSTYVPSMPWNTVIRESATNREFWDDELRDPAIYERLPHKRAAPDDEGLLQRSGSRPAGSSQEAKESKGQKKRRLAKEAAQRQQSNQNFVSSSGGKGKGKQDTTQQICYAWNSGTCTTPCPNNRKHICSIRNVPGHGAHNCWKAGGKAQAPKGKGKGKGKWHS